MKALFGGCYLGKKVIVTGNTGFKGSWLTMWLLEMGAEVIGISKDIPTQPRSIFEEVQLESRIRYVEQDIRDSAALRQLFEEIKPDFVFHLAAQAIVINSYVDPVDTMSTNVMGTVHVLEALRHLSNPCIAVMITSDKCYDNVEWLWGYRETDAVGGKDPYSASKGAAELMIKTYYHSFFSKADSNIRIAVVRAGNVIGGGDWAEKRIVPDCIVAWKKGESVDIRSPRATRPWQHVLEPLSGYLLVGHQLFQNPKISGEAFNFGPNADQDKTVVELIDALAQHWDGSTANKYKVFENSNFHEAGLLKLNCDKALAILKWKPVMSFEETTRFTAHWYKEEHLNGGDMYEYTANQLKEYTSLAMGRQMIWCKS